MAATGATTKFSNCVNVTVYTENILRVDLSSSVISINGNRNRNGNYLFPFREVGMRSRNYFENWNRIEIVIVI